MRMGFLSNRREINNFAKNIRRLYNNAGRLIGDHIDDALVFANFRRNFGNIDIQCRGQSLRRRGVMRCVAAA